MRSQWRFERTFSLEVFPPRTVEGAERLRIERPRLETLSASYFTVTSGAPGSPPQGTFEVVKEMRARGLDVAPHLTCIASSKAEMRERLGAYAEIGVRRLIALRGHPLLDGAPRGDFDHASDLVRFVRAEMGDRFRIIVGAYPEVHPESPSVTSDLANFKSKIDAGADAATTQFFFNVDAYQRFVEASEKIGIDVPIVPGIMPIVDYDRLLERAAEMAVEIPRWLRTRLLELRDDEAALCAFGEDVVTRLCETLLDAGAPGLHFYTMNRGDPTARIWRNLGLPALVPRS